MALAVPVVLYAVNGGSTTPLVPGTPAAIASGVLLGLSLQSSTGVVACTYAFRATGTSLDGQSFTGTGASFSMTQQIPVTPTTYTVAVSVTDGENVTSTIVSLVSSGSTAATLSGDVTGLSSNNLVNGARVPAAVASPEFNQTQATSGAGQTMRMRSQAAATGSNAVGGNLSFIVGNSDGTAASGTVRGIWLGEETAVGGVEPTTNYFGYGLLKHLPGGVVNLELGLGGNGVGGGVAGVEISAPGSLISIATEGANSPIQLQPASSFGGQSLISFAQNPADGQAVLALTSQSDTPAASGIIRIGWAGSTTLQPIFEQRNFANTSDLDIISRNANELYFGSYSEDNRYHALSRVQFEIFNSAGQGWTYSGPNGRPFIIGTDAAQTTSFGGDVGKDGRVISKYSGNTSSTSTTNVVSGGITIRVGVSKLSVTLVGVDQATGEFATFDLKGTFKNTAGTITAATAIPAAVDTGHSTSGTGVSPSLSVSTNQIIVSVTPWSTNVIHWSVIVDAALNTGTF